MAAARAEYDYIKQLTEVGKGSNAKITEILTERLRALAPYFQGLPKKPLGRDDLSRVEKDNQEMLKNIGLIYALSFPDFVSELVDYNLNAEEIGLCALYASGFVAKEVSDLIETSSIYHINSNIRKKLADVLDNHTLPMWIRNRFLGTVNQ